MRHRVALAALAVLCFSGCRAVSAPVGDRCIETGRLPRAGFDLGDPESAKLLETTSGPLVLRNRSIVDVAELLNRWSRAAALQSCYEFDRSLPGHGVVAVYGVECDGFRMPTGNEWLNVSASMSSPFERLHGFYDGTAEWVFASSDRALDPLHWWVADGPEVVRDRTAPQSWQLRWVRTVESCPPHLEAGASVTGAGR